MASRQDNETLVEDRCNLWLGGGGVVAGVISVVYFSLLTTTSVH